MFIGYKRMLKIMKSHLGTLSPLYIALFLSGGLSTIGHTQEIECKAGEINQQNNAFLKNCTINSPSEEHDFRLLAISNSTNLTLDNLTSSSNIDSLRINSSDVTIKNSNLESINESQSTWGPPSFSSVLSLDNATVNIENSTINSKPASSSQFNIKANNSNLKILNSTLRMQKIDDFVGEASAALYVNNGTAIVKDSIFDLDARADSYIETENNGKIILENTTSTNVRAYPDFLTIGEGKSHVELINSSFNGGIDSVWNLSKEIEQAELDLTLTNSSLARNVLFRSSRLPSYPGYREKTKQLIEKINFTAKDSSLSGSIQLLPNENGYIDDVFNVSLDNSSWELGDNYYVESPNVTDLTLKNANITISPRAEYFDENGSTSYRFTTFNILGNLSGNGNFTLNTDLANQQSDKIVVTGSDSGSFGLNINDSGNEPNAANGKVTLVETVTGTAQFALLGKDYVDAGAYRYRLNQEGNNWVLSNKANESSKTTQPEKPVEQPKPIVPVEEKPKPTTPSTSEQTTEAKPTLPVVPVMPPEQPKNPSNTEQTTEVSPTQPTVPVTPTEQPKPTTPESVIPPMVEKALSEKSNALVSLRQAQLALVESNLEGLHQRLGELKNGEKGNVWVRNVNSRNDFASTRTASDSHSSGFEQDVHSVQLGADAALTDNIRLGGFVGNARSDVDFDGEYGSGKVKTQSLGLYGTYLANNGFYWDNVAKYEYVKSESASTGKRKYNAYTLSTEIGRIHQLGQGWTVTPQIQAAWTRLSSQSDEERLSALTARAGVRVAKAIEFDSWKLQPYAEVNGITTQTNQSAVRVNQYLFDVAESKGRIQTALGINATVGNHRLGLEGSVTNGKYLDQPYKVQAVYRYSW